MQKYGVMPDGQRFVMVESEGGSRDTVIHVVQNWYEEFRAASGTKSPEKN